MRILLWIPTFDGNLQYIQPFLDRIQSKHHITVKKVVRRPIVDARNILMRECLEKMYDGIVFLDDDNPPIKTTAIDDLIDTWKELVSAVIRKRTDDKSLCICWFDNKEPLKYREWTKNKKWVKKCAVFGFGFCYISKNIVIDMMDKYNNSPFWQGFIKYVKTKSWREELDFKHLSTADQFDLTDGKVETRQRMIGEDYLFCERARSIWYTPFANCAVKCVHYREWEVLQV